MRLFTSADKPLLDSWWSAQGWPAIPLTHLPATGIIVDECAAGFLYKTDSQFALLEFVVGDPAVDKTRRQAAVDRVVECLTFMAGEAGYTAIFATIRHPRLQKAYEKSGFVVSDTGMNSMVRYSQGV